MAKKTTSGGGPNPPQPLARGTPSDSFILRAIQEVQSKLARERGAELRPPEDPPLDCITTDDDGDGFDDGQTPVYHRESPPGNQP